MIKLNIWLELGVNEYFLLGMSKKLWDLLENIIINLISQIFLNHLIPHLEPLGLLSAGGLPSLLSGSAPAKLLKIFGKHY